MVFRQGVEEGGLSLAGGDLDGLLVLGLLGVLGPALVAWVGARLVGALVAWVGARLVGALVAWVGGGLVGALVGTWVGVAGALVAWVGVKALSGFGLGFWAS